VKLLKPVKLIDALRYSGSSTLAFVGAGGKTTAIFKAARELCDSGELERPSKTILVTTTTHFGTWQVDQADHFFKVESSSDITRLEQNMPEGIVLLAGEETTNRGGSVPAELLEIVHRIAEYHDLPLLIEADGSATRPLKAPADHEPVIPDFTERVVVVAGLSGLGKPVTRNWIHRPEIFARLSGLNPGDVVTTDALTKVLRNQDGGLKNIPMKAQRTVLLNQADTKTLQSQGRELSDQLIHNYHSIIIASLSQEEKGPTDIALKQEQQGEIHAVVEQAGGIILAAGSASRYGKPKQLLPWKGKPLIRHVALSALSAGLSPVIVVVGARANEIEHAISDLPVRIVNNSEWEAGLSSSIQVGIENLPKEISGTVFYIRINLKSHPCSSTVLLRHTKH
jgi:molybdenum cofactor cytidylyltransferase